MYEIIQSIRHKVVSFRFRRKLRLFCSKQKEKCCVCIFCVVFCPIFGSFPYYKFIKLLKNYLGHCQLTLFYFNYELKTTFMFIFYILHITIRLPGKCIIKILQKIVVISNKKNGMKILHYTI